MNPILFELSQGLHIRSYSVFVVLGLLCGAFVTFRYGAKSGIARKDMIDLILSVTVGSMIGAKLLFFLIEIPDFYREPWTQLSVFGSSISFPRFLAIWEGGFVFYGGLIGGIITASIFSKRKNLSLGLALDCMVVGVALGHAWGRFACFLDGRCFGKAGGGLIGIELPDLSVAFEHHAMNELLTHRLATTTYAVHPVQLYESLSEILISLFLISVVLPKRKYFGQMSLIYLLLFSVSRFFSEIFRGDRDRGFVSDPVSFVSFNRWIGVDGGSPTVLSSSQLMSVVIFGVCLILMFLIHQKKKQSLKSELLEKGSERTKFE